MKKASLLCLLLVVGQMAWANNPAVSAELGGNFLNYNSNFLTMGASFQEDLGQGMEFDVGSGLGIYTLRDPADTAKTAAKFLIPISLGFNFLFPVQNFTFGLGIGLTPNFTFSNSGAIPLEFYLGPYVRGLIRVKIHPVMSIYTNLQQDLLIGGQNWVNTSTRIGAGLIFSLGLPAPRLSIPNQVAP